MTDGAEAGMSSGPEHTVHVCEDPDSPGDRARREMTPAGPC